MSSPIAIETLASVSVPHFETAMFIGFLLTIATLFCFVEMHRSSSFCLPFAICAGAMGVYGLVIGTWSLAILQSVWSISTAYRWHARRSLLRESEPARKAVERNGGESRITRLFGPAAVDSDN